MPSQSINEQSFKSKARLRGAPPLVHKFPMIRPARLLFVTVAALVLTGCAQFPELDQRVTADLDAADYPLLVPVDPLLAAATAGRVDVVQTQSTLEGRVDRLRARAARLRGSVLSGRERQRLARGLV